jgi:hypothetical protein
MHPRTPYNGVLLYHGVGVGKTCAAIQAAEAFLDVYPTSKVLIVAPKNIQAGFRSTVFDMKKVKIGNGITPNQSNQCTGTTYLKLGGTTFETDPAVIERMAAKAVASRYEFYGYIQFANRINSVVAQAQKMRLPAVTTLPQLEAQLLREEFGYKMLIIDEAHNIRDVEAGDGEDLDTIQEDVESEKAGKVLTPALTRLVEVVDGMKLILMTATPMFNSPKEIVFLLNLLLANDKKITLSKDHIFRKYGSLRKQGKRILGTLANAYVSFMRGENPNSFPVRLFPEDGRLTEEAYPKRFFDEGALDEGENGDEETTTAEKKLEAANTVKLPIVISNYPAGSEEEKLQSQINEYVKRESGYGYSGLNTLVQAGNIIFPEAGVAVNLSESSQMGGENSNEENGEEDGEENGEENGEDGDDTEESTIGDSSASVASLNASTFLARIGAGGFNNTFRKEKDRYTPTNGSVSWLRLGELEHHSPKMASIMQSIRRSEGVSFVYSRFVKAGALMMAFVLEAYGYTPYGRDKPFLNHPEIGRGGPVCALCDRRERDHGAGEEDGHAFTAAKYVLLTGDQTLSPKNAEAIQAEKDIKNANGSMIKVVLGSQIAGEGLDLKYVRDIHILDAWFHLNKTEQIIGRGIRFMSHCALPEEQRNTTVHLHVLGLGSASGPGTAASDNHESADLYSYRTSLRKGMLIGRVSRVLKTHAVDCNLRSSATVIQGLPPRAQVDSLGVRRPRVDVNDTPFTALCDWLDTCAYQCKPEIPIVKTDMDYSTYTNFHAQYMETEIKNHIRVLFQQQTSYSQADFMHALESATDFSSIAIGYVLRSIIGDRTFIVRHGSLEGYVLYRNTYYVFQPFIYQSTAIPLALRNAELPVKRDEYTPKTISASEFKTFRRYSPLDWDVVSEWIDQLEAGEITNEKPMGPIVGAVEEYVTDPDTGTENIPLRNSLLDKLKMIVHFMNGIPEEHRESASAAVRAYFWDTWLSKEQQLELLKTGEVETGNQNRLASESEMIYRFVNPYKGTIEYMCKGGKTRCSSALVERLEMDKMDTVRVRAAKSAVAGRVGPMYGFVIYKKGEFKFKLVDEPADAKSKKPARGIMCEIISQSSLMDKYMLKLHNIMEEYMGLELRFYRRLQRGMYESNAQKCVLIELQLRLLQQESAGGLRWFYRPLEALYSGHVGERELVEAKIPKAAAAAADGKTRRVGKPGAQGTQVKAQLIPLQRPAAVETRSRAPVSPEESLEEVVKPKKKRRIVLAPAPAPGQAQDAEAKPLRRLKLPPASQFAEPKEGPMYFEHQESLLCGKHALNNLLGAEVFKNSDLKRICKNLTKTLKPTIPLCNESGFYGDDVIETALKNKGYDVQDIYAYEGGQRFVNEETGAEAPTAGPANNPKYRELSLNMVLRQGHTIGNFLGILIVNGGHWIAIKKVGDGYMWLDSLYDAPNEARDKIIDFGSVEEELDTQIEAMIQKAKDFNGGIYIRKEDVAKTKDAKDDVLLKKQKKKNWRGSEMAQGHNRILAVYRGEAHDFFPEVRAYQPAEARGAVEVKEPTESPEEAVVVAGPKSILKRKNVGAPLEPDAVLNTRTAAVPKRKIRLPPAPPPESASASGQPLEPDAVLKTKKRIRIRETPNVKLISPRVSPSPEEEEKEEKEEGQVVNLSNKNEEEGAEEKEVQVVNLSDEDLDTEKTPSMSPLAAVKEEKSKSTLTKENAERILAELEDEDDEEEEDEEEEENEESPKKPSPKQTQKSELNLLDELESDEEEEEDEEDKKPQKKPSPKQVQQSTLNLLDELESDEEDEEDKKPQKKPSPKQVQQSTLNLLDELESDDE